MKATVSNGAFENRSAKFDIISGGRFGLKHTMWGVLVTDEQTNEQAGFRI